MTLQKDPDERAIKIPTTVGLTLELSPKGWLRLVEDSGTVLFEEILSSKRHQVMRALLRAKGLA